MSCAMIRRRLSMIADHERLGGAHPYLGLLLHCVSCGECRVAWKRLRQLRALCDRLPVVAPPERVRVGVMSNLPDLEIKQPILSSGGNRHMLVRTAGVQGMTAVVLATIILL